MKFLQSARAVAFRPAVAAMILGLMVSPNAVQAALITYTSEAAWQSAVTSPALINFDNLANGTAVSNQYAGVTFSPFNGGTPLTIAESNPYSPANTLTVDSIPGTTSGDGGFAIDFATAQQGVAFWYNDSEFAGNLATVYGSSNQILGTFELEFPRPAEWLFVGFTSFGNDISKVGVAMGNPNRSDRVTFDNIQYSAAITTVPEPVSIALLLAGGLMLSAVRRARRF